MLAERCTQALLAISLLSSGGGSSVTHAPDRESSEKKLEALAWLEGSWQGVTAEGALAEIHYSRNRAGTLLGSMRLSEDGQVQVLELIVLHATPEGVFLRLRHFDVTLEPWEERAEELLLTAGEANRWDFENTRESRLKRSSYIREGPGTHVGEAVLVGGASFQVRYERVKPSSDDGPALASNDQPAPRWYREHLGHLLQQGGRTIASNADYQAESEPFDAYGIEWTATGGGQSLRGRLFALKDGVEMGDIWSLQTVWDPRVGEALVHQTSADGTFAVGPIRPLEGGGIEIEQTLFLPDGSTQQIRHESTPLEGGGRQDISFSRKDGQWQVNRRYIWLPVPLPAEQGR